MNIQKDDANEEMYSHLYPRAEAYIEERFGFFSADPLACLLSTRFLIASTLNDVENGYFTLEQAEKKHIKNALDIAMDFFLSRKDLRSQ